MTSLAIDIHLQSSLWKSQSCCRKSIVRKILVSTLDTIRAASKKHYLSLEVSFLLTDNEFIQQLNAQYRNQNNPTNVLAFPLYSFEELHQSNNPECYQEPHKVLGDIVLAYETIFQEAIDQKKSFEHHFTHLVIHGWLHLWGYDHQNDQEADIMENLEITTLSKFAISNPYKNMV